MSQNAATSQPSEHQVFDKAFVAAAVLIGAGYVVIIAVVNRLLGSSAAGVAGVALTALATGIFKQFENLRFRLVDSPNVVAFQRPRVFDVLTAIMTLYGFQAVLGVIAVPAATFIAKQLHITVDASDISALLSNKVVFAAIIIANCVAFFLAGFVLAKAVPRLTIATIAVCSFVTLIFFALMVIITIMLSSGITLADFKYFSEGIQATFKQYGVLYAAWILYVALSGFAAFQARRTVRPMISSTE